MITHRSTPSGLAAAALIVGVSTALFWAPSAQAASSTCGAGGTLLAGGICEQTFTSVGTVVFTPASGVTQLEALLVGGGGGSSDGYAGGGGDVKVVGFADFGTAFSLVVGGSAQASSVTQGSAPTTQALPGVPGGKFFLAGASGNGNAGSTGVTGGGGGGAGASPVGSINGGAGATVSVVALAGSLFATDAGCYGGGGAYGSHDSIVGVATCGGGYLVDDPAAAAATEVLPVPNSGGGAGGSLDEVTTAFRTGAAGLVVVRWKPSGLPNTGTVINPAEVTLAGGVLATGLGLLGFSLYRRRGVRASK